MTRALATSLYLLAALAACGRERDPAPVPDARPSAPAVAADARLVFKRDGAVVRDVALRDLVAKVPSEDVRGWDPYYARDKAFRAVPLAKVLALGFPGDADLRGHDYVLRARDGYAVPMTGAKVLEEGAYVAYADLDVPGWEPIGPQRANPAPLYLVWSKPEQRSLETHPRPWQLASIEIAPFEATYPHVAPRGAGEDALRGFAIFRSQCFACHAVNREGGRVGPELNVPQSIVEYRPEAQIRAYIRNPRTFRYGNMPAHPHLTEADLDGLVAYFRAMRERKHDADAAKDAGSP